MYRETEHPVRYGRAERASDTRAEISIVENLPLHGGKYTLPEGSVIQLLKPGEKKILSEAMDVVIGAPSTEILRCRQFAVPRVEPSDVETMSPFQIQRDLRDVIVNNRVVGYVYGDEIYMSEKYPND